MKPYSPVHTITTTAKREVQILLLKKGTIITLVILLLAILGFIGFAAWQKDKDESGEAGPAVAAVGVDAQLLNDAGYDGRAAADRDEAEQLVRDGDVKAALVAEANRWEVVSDGMPSTSILTGLEGLSQQYSRAETLHNLGISEADYEAASPQIEVVPVDVSGDDDTEEHFIRLLTTFVALMVVIFTVITFAAQVGSRVTEEKSSRVVELVLSSVRPLDFLAGKLLGTFIIGFLSTAVLLLVGGVGLHLSGLADGLELDWSVFPILLIAWALAMLFFGALYAAAGAMVQRTEDLQSTQMPILLLIMATAYIPGFGWMATDTTWMQVLSWIPPFSIFAAPLSFAAGDFTGPQLAGSFALAALVTALVVWFAARIYKRSILNNGSVTKWSQVLRQA
ncbi:ABC transporter permease [Corynebacterium wankanglinii]|uniref:ABC transporter permease n=1 Tax=Corynebacterium wankanglinii TaxID=2735136 RepID=A0A838CK30_9CORY|nr:ABC transporter permease [Corynebacterium wankanglinii]MBA1834880.1 ABC transporter permease [Corynebacterium wankanglinii]